MQQLTAGALATALTVSRSGPREGQARPAEQRQQLAASMIRQLEKELPRPSTQLAANAGMDLLAWANAVVGDQNRGGTLCRPLRETLGVLVMACAGPNITAAGQLGELAQHLPCSRTFVAARAAQRAAWQPGQAFYGPQAPPPNVIRIGTIRLVHEFWRRCTRESTSTCHVAKRRIPGTTEHEEHPRH